MGRDWDLDALFSQPPPTHSGRRRRSARPRRWPSRGTPTRACRQLKAAAGLSGSCSPRSTNGITSSTPSITAMAITAPQMSGSIPRFAAMMFMPRVQLIGYVGLKPRPPGSSSVPKSGDDWMSWGAVPGSRGTRIETRQDDPEDEDAKDDPAPDVLAEARGSATGAQPERHRDALEPDQQVVPADEEAQEDRHDRDVQDVDLDQLLGRGRDRQEGVGGVVEGAGESDRIQYLGDVPRNAEAHLVPVERLTGQRDDEREAGQARPRRARAPPSRPGSPR